MKTILPVIDLLDGVVVRGVAGERERYRPVQSTLTADPSPRAVAEAYRNALGFRDVYVADLDAISGNTPNWLAYDIIAEAGLNLWIDAGVSDRERAVAIAERQFANKPAHRIIVGLESLRSDEQLSEIMSMIDRTTLVFSLDLKSGSPLAKCPIWQGRAALEIAEDVIQRGIQTLIVLDLARVGVGQGCGTEKLCATIKERWPGVKLIGGGGVNSRADVDRLIASGLSRVLVASALHNGRINGRSAQIETPFSI